MVTLKTASMAAALSVVLAAGAAAAGSAVSSGAALSVSSTKPVLVGHLRNDVPINSNRGYTFVGVPEDLAGLQFTVHEHRNPGALTADARESGTVYLALWEGVTPAALELQGDWTAVGALDVGTISCEPFALFRSTVAAGTRLVVPVPNRWGAVLMARNVDGPAVHAGGLTAGTTEEAEYQLLTAQIRRHSSRAPELKAKLRREAVHEAALIRDDDAAPTGVVLRRVEALIRHLAALHPRLDLAPERRELSALRERLRTTSAAEERRLFSEACRARRKVAFRNPALAGLDRIVFLKHGKQARGDRHMIDQYLGFNAAHGGGIFVLEGPFGPEPRVRDLLADSEVEAGRLAGRVLSETGSFIALDLDYGADEIVFSWTEGRHELPERASYDQQFYSEADAKRLGPKRYYHYRPGNTYHVFRARIDGTGLTQLTDGRWNDIDPCFLPNGDIVFMSERGEGGIRCGSRPLVSTTLHTMDRDGGGLRALSRHDTNEWHPSVNNDGMIVYTRWDYVDRDSDIAHHIWQCFPDGRDPRSLHGNYPDVREHRPWMEMSIRAIPGSHRYVATATPHHGEAYGSLVLLDLRQADDGAMGQLKRLTPEYHFPESESAPGVPHPPLRGRHRPPGEFFGTAWPLTEELYLCVYAADQRNYALCLLDSFGNVVELYRDPSIACLDPIPLRPRRRPPIIPPQTPISGGENGTIARIGSTARLFIADVYATDRSWPEGIDLAELRVISVFPKSNVFLDEPRVGVAPQSLARGVLGTVPIKSDGSVFCEIPAGVGIYFQVLDRAGLAVQTMRSITYARAGELLACVGCHEHKHQPPLMARSGPVLALQRPPSTLAREASGSYPLTFPRLVQPALDAHCVTCHGKTPKAPSLCGTSFGKHGWSEAALTLGRLAWGKAGGNGSGLRCNGTSYSVPGDVGARASALYRMLAAGHHDVVLSPDALRRITLWLDANSCFYGAYADPAEQARGATPAPKTGFLAEWVH